MSYKNREKCAEKLRLNFNEVKKEYEKHNCILLSNEEDYKNKDSRLEYICSCGRKDSRTFCDFKFRQWQCRECVKEEIFKEKAIKTGFDFIGIKNLYNSYGFEIKTIKDFYSQKDVVEYECKLGHINFKTISSFKRNPICKDCEKEKDRLNRWNNNVKLAQEKGLKVIGGFEDFVDNYSKIILQCSCGEIFSPIINEFRNNKKCQCNKCGILSKSGEFSYKWKGGITTEQEKIRKSSDYKEWRNNVFKRDNYTCQCCGDSTGGNLQAHHKYNFSEYPELRFDVNNGITLCNKCHDFSQPGSFHHTYGATNNTPEQLEEYISNYQKQHKITKQVKIKYMHK